MKHYTTIEQSKKLLSLGLSPETADMAHIVKRNDCRESWELAAKESGNVHTDLKDYFHMRLSDYALPCWSLGALLEIMPDEIKVNGTNCNLYIAKDFISYEGLDRYDTSTTIQPMVFYDKPFIELLFEAICWLLENNYLKTEK